MRIAFPLLIANILVAGGLAAAEGTAGPPQGAAPISLSSLLHEMVDRDALARLPEPGWRSHQVTSHDARKRDPADAAGWHSNDDGKAFIRTETRAGRTEWVIAEDHGAGAITRIWNPLHALHAENDHQVVRFYVDGGSEPVITARFLDLVAGRDFVKPPMAFTATDRADFAAQQRPDFVARDDGGDLYLPIPFASGFKITLDSEPFYYSVTYRTYAAGTAVESFSMAAFAAAAQQLSDAGAELLAIPAPPAQRPPATVIAPGATVTIALPAGAAAVRDLEVELDPADPAALRTTVIEAVFDGEPCVWCPLSEFFGAGVRFRPVHDRFRTVGAAGRLAAHWTMPYRSGGTIALRNLGAGPLRARLGISTSPWTWDERSMHFHAGWHSRMAIPTRPMLDWNYITIAGTGSYVGDTMSVYSPAPEWFGEGDERIAIDGESLASQIGTGTEDYYGFAWGMARQFSSPFISAPRRDGARHGKDDWRGYTTDSRLRQLDVIPFAKGLKHDMEIWDWADTKVDYAVGLFWYGLPGATCNVVAQVEDARAPLRAFTPPFAIPGAVECETATVVERSSDLELGVQEGYPLTEGAWSDERQLFVHPKRPGDHVVLAIPVPDARPYRVALHATCAADYGILRFSIDGQRAGPDFDGYRPQAAASGPIQLGTFTTANGTLRLRVEVVGANPAAIGARCLFGLDCVTLTPVE